MSGYAIQRARTAACGVIAATVALCGAAGAQVLSEREARSAIASPRGVSVVVSDLSFVTPQVARALEQYAAELPYYAAIAVSPGEPASSQVSPGAVNFHAPEDAQRAALAACNAARTTGAPCVIVAQTVPRRYEAGRPTLSVQATEALRGAFRQMDSPKALAISSSTGQFAFARGDGARALAQCNAAAAGAGGARDCRIVVADR
jgi:hypothetical protein